jgi:prolyl-tRNA synthetase
MHGKSILVLDGRHNSKETLYEQRFTKSHINNLLEQSQRAQYIQDNKQATSVSIIFFFMVTTRALPIVVMVMMWTSSLMLMVRRRLVVSSFAWQSRPLTRSNYIMASTTTTATTRLFSSSLKTVEEKAELEAKIKIKGDEIRALKDSGADKSAVGPLVAELLALKEQLSGEPAKPSKAAKQPKQQQQASNNNKADDDAESEFITARAVDYSRWYNDLVRVCGLAEPSPVRGCMIIKPWGMSLWDAVKTELDQKIKEHGAENAYFPLLIPKSFLSKEAEHVDGFAKECAVVTHHRLKAGTEEEGLIADPDALLEEPLIIRPTSETMIWYTFRKWIKSHRDLPLKINQWANVMRWEMRTRSFLRTSEFLWQEGHTAHATREGAQEDAQTMLNVYAELCENLLALPVVRGVKSPSERFAGAEETYTIEALMQNGWALQSGTSHFLGQSFGKAFDVKFQDEQGKMADVWGTSWGVSTRLLGALIMTHSDDAGLVLPPRIAPVQVVIVPIPPKKDDEEAKEAMDSAITTLMNELKSAGVRVKLDDRDFMRSGAKFFEWERKGVPLRIEVGPRDVKQNACIFKYRTGSKAEAKATVDLSNAANEASKGLKELQQEMFDTAAQNLKQGITRDVSYSEMKAALENDEASVYPGRGLFLVPWKCNAENEDKIKEECRVTIRCYPLEANEKGLHKSKKCFYSGDDATHMALFGRAF